MTALAAVLGILLCVLSSCGVHRQAAHAGTPRSTQDRTAIGSELAACETRLCRLQQYAAAFPRGEVVAVRDDVGSVKTRTECAPLHWRRISGGGTWGNAFDETTQMLWIGRDAALVAETAELAGRTSTINGEVSDDATRQRLDSRELAEITLESVTSGMPAYHQMHDIDPPERTGRECKIVYLDSCLGLVGYVCSGFDVRTRYETTLDGDPLPPDGRHVFEIEVFEIELDPRRTTYHLVNGEALEVE